MTRLALVDAVMASLAMKPAARAEATYQMPIQRAYAPATEIEG